MRFICKIEWHLMSGTSSVSSHLTAQNSQKPSHHRPLVTRHTAGEVKSREIMPRGLGTPLLGPSEAAGVSRIEKRVELQKIAKKLLRGLVHAGDALFAVRRKTP